MAARVISAVLRDCSRFLGRTCLPQTGLLRFNLRHFSLISRFRTQSVYLPLLQCIAPVHSAKCVRSKVNLWNEYNRVKSCVEGKV